MNIPLLTYRDGPAHGVVHVDLDRFIASRMLIQANSGAGKSRAIRQLLEQTHGRVQHLVIDPEGEFSTLRERFDYVLAAKTGADVEASSKTARVLCRRLVELGASAVLDLYDLGLPERREFVRLFLTELMALPRAMWKPILVVIDEAHVFVPERGSGEAQSTEAVITLATQGRKRGFCAVLATQRISKLHKDAAAELLNKLIGRTGLDVDVKRAGEELGFKKDERRDLKTLSPGEFYAYGPAISNEVQIVRTGDVLTSHPEAGRIGAAAPPPSSKVKALLASALADLPKEAETEAKTVEDLKRQVAQLTREKRALGRGQGQPTERVVTKPVVDQAAIDRAVHAAIAKRASAAGRALDRVVTPLNRMRDLLGTAIEGLDGVRAAWQNGDGDGVMTVGTLIKADLPKFRVQPETARPRPKSAPSDVGDVKLGLGERRVLTAIAQYPDGADREQLTVLTGYKRSSRNTYLQRLQAGGFVEFRGENVIATDAGIAALGSDFEPLPTGAELRDYWLGRLPEGERRILSELIELYPDFADRESVGASAGYKRSSRNTYIQRLGARKLIETSGGEVRAARQLFED